MEGIKFLILIGNRDNTEQYKIFLKKYDIKNVCCTFSHGTASDKMLELAGLLRTEKVILYSAIRQSDIERLSKDFYSQPEIFDYGNGLIALLPTGGFSESAIKFFLGNSEFKTENVMEEVKNNLSLIVTIADKGNIDLIMDSARSAGATGGTVVRASGTGTDIAKILGISISEEKEMIYIISKKEDRNNIMQSIMEKAGASTDAHGIVFSLPIEKVLGIRGLEN